MVFSLPILPAATGNLMRVQPVLSIVALCLLLSCQTKEQKNEARELDSDYASMPMDTQDVVNDELPVLADPDINDTLPSSDYEPNTYNKSVVKLVRNKLQARYAADIRKGLLDKASRTFMIYTYDLNGDNKNEIFVAHTGSYFCGSGGCTIELLSSTGEVITTFTVTDVPIIIGDPKTRGWHDLYLLSGSKYHTMKFNGRNYPSNPSVAPVPSATPDGMQPRVLDYENEQYPRFSF